MPRAKKQLTRCFGLILILGIGLGWFWSLGDVSAANEAVSPFRLVAVWTESGLNQDLKSWTVNELSKFKKTESRERDPISGKILNWKGVLLSNVIEKALGDLTPENRAQVDLVVLKGGAGTRALIPRAMITKYPVMLALQTTPSDSDPSIQSRGPVYSVIPWSTKPKILEEGLPLENYFVSNLERIELTSYKNRFSSLFLKRRTDPSAMRGEKLFVQNCIGCHSEGDPKVYKFGQAGSPGSATGVEHPAMKAALRLTEKDKKSLISYLNAYKAENAAPMASTITGSIFPKEVPKQAESDQKSFVQ